MMNLLQIKENILQFWPWLLVEVPVPQIVASRFQFLYNFKLYFTI